MANDEKRLTLFPELDNDLSSNLYIIGNGFDIMHGLSTKYEDFRKWLVTNGDEQFVKLMNLLFPYAPDNDDNNENWFWSDIENYLGEYRARDIMMFCVPDDLSYNNGQKYAFAVEDGPQSIFIPAVCQLFDKFHEWVDSIKVESLRKLYLHPECYYLSFNYTETLEKVYGIPDDHICHIHGKRNVDQEYVFGHSNLVDEDDIRADYIFEQKALFDIASEMNSHIKDFNGIVKSNDWFFNKLTKINRITVIGHSLGKIDLPYFDRLIEMVPNDTEWIFYYHSDEDIKNIADFIASRGIIHYQYKYI